LGATALTVLAVLVLSGWVSAPTAASAGFCETEVIRNYVKPLERLPKLRGLPAGAELPFGPKGLSLRRKGGEQPLLFESKEVGFTLSYKRSEGGVPRPRLDWLVTTSLVRVDRRGRTLRLMASSHRGVTRPGPRVPRTEKGSHTPFRLSFDFEPGLYRLEIVFEDRAGQRLGRFGEYFRALRPKREAPRFSLNGTIFRPGDTAIARVENYGGGWLTFGVGYAIEFFDGSNWAPVQLPFDAVPAIKLGAGPGVSASCWRYPIPGDAAFGLYRFVETVEQHPGVKAPPVSSYGTPFTLTAEFQVQATSG